MTGSPRGTVVWVDGRPPEHGIDPLDHGIVTGDGAFETIRILGGAAFAVAPHLTRLERSLIAMGIHRPDLDRLAADIHRIAATSALADGRLRVTVTAGAGPLSSVRGAAGPTVILATEPCPPAAAVETVVTCPWTRNERGVLCGVKSTSYADNVVALAWAKAHGGGEAMFLNTSGQVSEGTGSNVFAVIDGRLATPPITGSGCLAGITRACVLELADSAEETEISPDALAGASEVFLTSTTRDVQPVGVLDGITFAAPGPITTQIRERFLAHQPQQLEPRPAL